MKAGLAVVALAGVLGGGVAMADGDLVIVLQHAAKVVEKLPDSSSQVTVVVSVVGAVVGLIALTVAWSQMKIASAKTKLDLYNKRFGVYLAALEFYQCAYSKTREGHNEKASKLTHAYRESKFLFDAKDGVYETLGRFQKAGAAVRAYDEFNKHGAISDSDRSRKLFEKYSDALLNMETDILKLEGQLKAYLSFHNVRGWTFF
ncbi:hypothetical protein QZR14_22465 [Pseudomonas sp. rhizo66]|uniref:hypothetical protein n=1 Tax=Pseudomonas sp. rhizo66 TaxID=3059674 RepID=UPI00288F4FBB|nr:hypothetical protein [Pseudomonas sp. rhizo66]MDT3314135.1 hypothetical protein [Pseudomonas sp. rhizo66]